MPPFSDDDVLDFMVVEAMTFKIAHIREEERKKQESKDRIKAHTQMRGMGGAAPPQGG